MNTEAKDCEFLEGCPIFARFRNEALGDVWTMYYCKGGQHEDCARKKLKLAGEEVPITLLPNGKHLPELADG